VRHNLQGDGSAIALKEYPEYEHLWVVFADVLFYSNDDNLSRVA
jgi:hypothetical protein